MSQGSDFFEYSDIALKFRYCDCLNAGFFQLVFQSAISTEGHEWFKILFGQVGRQVVDITLSATEVALCDYIQDYEFFLPFHFAKSLSPDRFGFPNRRLSVFIIPEISNPRVFGYVRVIPITFG